MAATTRRLLIVDDEQRICHVLEEFFSTRGLSVTSAYSGEEAMARLNEGPFDVVLIDILLPGIHGIEVLKRARQVSATVRVVMMTGLQDDELRAQAQAYGADAYITKPFDLTDQTWSAVLNP